MQSREFSTLPRTFALLCLLLGFALLIPGVAAAQPDATATVIIAHSGGAFTATKVADAFSDTNPLDPFPGDGDFTYVFTLMNDPLSPVPLTQFQVTINDISQCAVATTGVIAGAGVAPDVASPGVVGSDVTWVFTTTPIGAGATSEKLYLTSPCGPGMVQNTVTSVTGAGIFDANGDCLGPVEPPDTTGPPDACTIGFWKNRADGKQGTLQHFPDPQFDGLVTDAVALSGGVFADEADLLAALGSKGKRPIGERGEQQLAATLLNLAASDAYPDNQKCRLFEGNTITTNACGDNISVGDAVSQAIIDLGGDTEAQHDAQECLDDINNGISLSQ